MRFSVKSDGGTSTGTQQLEGFLRSMASWMPIDTGHRIALHLAPQQNDRLPRKGKPKKTGDCRGPAWNG